MFTGIISITGKLREHEPVDGGIRLTVDPGTRLENPLIGESVAINGVCLTIEDIPGPNRLVFHLSEETLRRTTLKHLDPGLILNMERALKLEDRLDGHLVSGHVDAIGKISRFNPRENKPILKVRYPENIRRFVAPKGSIAIDGISLTIAELDEDCFSVALIPHTVNMTNLLHLGPGDVVNLEVDMIARYVVRAIECGVDPRGVTREFLKEAGLLNE